MEAKSKQLSELTEELQQPLQLTADVDSFGDELETKLEDGEVEEKENSRQRKDLHTSFQLGKGRHQDRFLEVIGDEIIITSERSPFRKITFTLNRWMHLMSYLKDIDTTVKPDVNTWEMDITSKSSTDYFVSTFECIMYHMVTKSLKFVPVQMESPSASMNGRI